MKAKTIKKIIIVVIIIGLIAAFKFFDLGQYLSFSYLKESRDTLVTLYEEMGSSDKADEFGAHGLSHDPKDLSGLTELITIYAEKNQLHTRGLRYLKKSALIMKEQKQYDQALKVWLRIAEFEPHDKGHWSHIADIYEALGRSAEAAASREKAK